MKLISVWKTILFVLLLLLGNLFFISCKKECDKPLNVIRVQFIDTTETVVTLTFDTVYTASNTTEISLSANTGNIYELPIPPQSQQISYNFEYQRPSGDSTITRSSTILFNYATELHLLRPNCGLTEKVINLEVGEHSFKRAEVISKNAEEDETQINVQIYLED